MRNRASPVRSAPAGGPVVDGTRRIRSASSQPGNTIPALAGRPAPKAHDVLSHSLISVRTDADAIRAAPRASSATPRRAAPHPAAPEAALSSRRRDRFREHLRPGSDRRLLPRGARSDRSRLFASSERSRDAGRRASSPAWARRPRTRSTARSRRSARAIISVVPHRRAHVAAARRRRDPHPPRRAPALHARQAPRRGAERGTRNGEPKRRGLAGYFFSTLVLTLTNPMTFVAFAAIFTTLGIGATRGHSILTVELVGGVFAGSALWFTILCGARARRAAPLRLSQAHRRQPRDGRLRDRGRDRLPAAALDAGARRRWSASSA